MQETAHPALQLLAAIGRGNQTFNYRCFLAEGHTKHKKPNGTVNVRMGALHPNAASLRRLEGFNREGFRIYFVVNKGGQKANEITSATSHFAEWDDPAMLETFEHTDWSTFAGGFLQPTAALSSGNKSPHAHWALSEPYKGIEGMVRWRINQNFLNAVLGSDPAIEDPSRVMRLPGFNHTNAEGEATGLCRLFYCDPERRYTRQEFETAIYAQVKSRGISYQDALNHTLCNGDHRELVITTLEELLPWVEGLREEFEEFFRPRSNSAATDCFVDARPKRELEAALRLIPPYVKGNGTYNGENPVTLADGSEVSVNYFRLMKGFAAAWTQLRLPIEEGIDFLFDAWGGETDRAYLQEQLTNGNGTIKASSFWHFARVCGYELEAHKLGTKGQILTNKNSASADGGVEGESSVELINRVMREIYDLQNTYKDSWSEIKNLKAQLYGFGISDEAIQERLIDLLEQDFGLIGAEESETPRVALEPGQSRIYSEDLMPGFLMLGRQAVVVAPEGSQKTTIAALIGKAVVEGEHFPLANGPVRKKGRVLFIASDGGEAAIGTIEEYVKKFGGIDLGRYKGTEKWLFYGANRAANQSAWSFCCRDLHTLARDLERFENTELPVRLVVIDSLMAVCESAGIDPGVGAMPKVMRLIGRFATRYNCCFLWLHHTLKRDSGIAGGHADITRIPDSVHFLELVDRPSSGDVLRRWTVKKHRNAPERSVLLTVELGKGVVISTADTQDEVRYRICRELKLDHDDDGVGLSARTIASYIADEHVREGRVKAELAAMRRITNKEGNRFLKGAEGKWKLLQLGLEWFEQQEEKRRLQQTTAALEHAGLPTAEEPSPSAEASANREEFNAGWADFDIGITPTPMDPWDSLKAVADFEGCIDVAAQKVS